MQDTAATSPEDEPVLVVEDLRTEFHLRHSVVRAVDGVSFSVGAGECVGLVGESGCGKSTTGLSIMKLLPSVGHVTAGTVRLAGRDLASIDERTMREVRGNDMAMIFQDPMTSLNPTWTIGRQIAEVVRLHRDVTRPQALERALEVLDLVGMPQPSERLRYYPHQLSGGLRQRVMIAMALACEPTLLIADEPTTALDVTIQAQILDLIDDLRERLKMAVVLITHDMGVIAARTDRVMVMYAGKIVEGAATGELFRSMRHPYAEALLQSIPRLDQDRSARLATIPGLPPDLSKTIVGCRFAPRCRYADDRCRREEPLLAPAGPTVGISGPATGPGAAPDLDGSHDFACFHPIGSEMRAPSARLEPSSARPEPPPPPSTRARDALGGTEEVVLELSNLTKEYAVSSGAVFQRKVGTLKAVSDVSLSVRRGETFGLVGESGCGKTTIGRVVVALERPTSGAVRFDGVDLSEVHGAALRERRRDLQLMFQDPYASLDPRMRVVTIVREPLVVQGIGTRDEQTATVESLLDEVGLARRARSLYPHEFSGGQRQRIGLARALALNPKLIVADEPVSALDVSIQAQILNLMRTLQERHGLTYIVISHDLAVVKYVADRIGVMYLGKLVEVGPADAVYGHTAHPYTQGLIDTVPVPDPAARRARGSHAVRGELPSAISPPSGCRFRTRCPYAQELCAAEEPPLRPFGREHLAACHFPLQLPLDGALATAAAPA
ncbi:MAG: ABC transporter ATP-binding protein [Actinomycetota bacterium]|nr:ABC transporter ATP-binding protein [Actinomycetota bacterium]